MSIVRVIVLLFLLAVVFMYADGLTSGVLTAFVIAYHVLAHYGRDQEGVPQADIQGAPRHDRDRGHRSLQEAHRGKGPVPHPLETI